MVTYGVVKAGGRRVLSGEGRGSSCIEWGRQGVVTY